MVYILTVYNDIMCKLKGYKNYKPQLKAWNMLSQSNCKILWSVVSQKIFTKSRMQIREKGVGYLQHSQERHQNEANDVIVVFFIVNFEHISYLSGVCIV